MRAEYSLTITCNLVEDNQVVGTRSQKVFSVTPQIAEDIEALVEDAYKEGTPNDNN